LADSFKIIGIHCRKNTKTNINYGVFIEEIIDDLYVQNSIKIPKMGDELNSDNDLDSAPSINAFQIITLRYKNTNTNFIKIFGDIFVRNNGNNC